MACTHCGHSSTGTHRLVFHRSEKEIEMQLCEDCLEELLGESGIDRREE